MILALLLPLFVKQVYADSSTREKLGELHQIRAEIKKSVFEKARFQQDILKSQIDIESQRQQIEKNTVESAALKAKIIERAAITYKLRRAAPDGTLFNLLEGHNLLRRTYYLQFLSREDKRVVTEYQSKSKKNEELKTRVEKYRQRLLVLQRRTLSKYEDLKEKEKRQREIIRSIRSSLSQNEPAQGDSRFFSELRGQLPKPIEGTLVSSVGLKKDSENPISLLRTGIVVSAQKGSEVKSVYNGEVIHASNVEGWGPTVIIDHGESYYSIYSFLSKLSVRPGERVLAQQKLAEVGEVPYYRRTPKGLYFEIRHYSEPEDPKSWLKESQNE